MASPPFEVEDQDDGDFFDRLIEDDDDLFFTKPGLKVGVEDGGIDEVKKISNLTISEVASSGVEVEPRGKDFKKPGFTVGVEDGDTDEVKKISHLTISKAPSSGEVELGGKEIGSGDQAEKGSDDGANLVPLDANEDNYLRQSSLTRQSDVNHSSEMMVGEKGASDDTIDKVGVGSVTGLKEVQWTSFSSHAKVRDLSGSRSFSDFFDEFGDNSEDPFATLASKDDSGAGFSVSGVATGKMVTDLASTNNLQNHEGQSYDSRSGQYTDAQNLSSSQYWENLYPGWKYDPSSGQWHQLEGYDISGTANNAITNGVLLNQNSDANNLQQAAQSGLESVSEEFTTASVSNWNQNLQGNNGYIKHMVFDPQYPDWYYDTIAQEWRMLESYAPATDHSANAYCNQQHQNANFVNYGSQGVEPQKFVTNYGESGSHYSQQNMNMWQTHSFSENVNVFSSESKQLENLYSSIGSVGNLEQQNGIESSGLPAPYKQVNQAVDSSNELSRFQSFTSTEQYSQNHNQNEIESIHQMQFKPAYFDAQKSSDFSNHALQSGSHFAFATTHGRSPDGRPPHALVAFGFGGKLIILKSNTLSHTTSAYGSQDSLGGVVNVLNLMEVVTGNTNASCSGLETHDYFHTLCQQSFPGPLLGGNVGNKEVNRWIDERIANFESSGWDYRMRETLRVLLSLLKIACQYYGKLRSPFGADEMLKGSDCPESAVAGLFGSAKKLVQSSEYGGLKYCLQNLPSEADLQATAFEVQKLLVSGRKKEALERAQEGQLWGPALVLASQLGDQFFGETVKQMAVKHLMAGSPLRTLCLLIAGQPADVFSSASPRSTNLPGYVNNSYQPGQFGANMLDDWEENLAVIAANRTKDDELVIIHLGDSLWRERSEVIAAHICYLIAESNFEPYSDSSRLCLLGADHWKFPRTYASPAAIQRTEVYEFSKTLGNSQFLLLPFQPYKLVYACMLAEVGKVADSLKYCQAILKSLKIGRAPEVDTWKLLVSSLEERLRIHQQSGYSANLAPTKLVGKLLTFIDSTAHRVVGGPPPPAPSSLHGSIQQNEFGSYPVFPKASGSLSTMTTPSLMPSTSMEPISEWVGQNNQSVVPNRSVSEPDFVRSPKKVLEQADTPNETKSSKVQEKADTSNETKSSKIQEKAAAPTGPSRFGRFGSQLFQKTVGLVIRSRPHNQAKLGEKNSFYYDEKLKRWVEEGAEPPAEEAALPPPPTTSAFQDGMADYSKGDVPKLDDFQTNSGSEIKSPGSSERNSGIPPIPPISNQFSARARLGARSRYVDTFNKSGSGGGGTQSNFFQSPSIPSAKTAGASNPKFFIPAPVPSSTVTTNEEVVQNTGESLQVAPATNENPSSFKEDSSSPMSSPGPAFPSVAMQRFPSTDHITRKKTELAGDQNSDFPHSRRTVSWSGSLGQGSPGETAIKPPAEAMSTSFYSAPSLHRDDSQASNSGDELIL